LYLYKILLFIQYLFGICSTVTIWSTLVETVLSINLRAADPRSNTSSNLIDVDKRIDHNRTTPLCKYSTKEQIIVSRKLFTKYLMKMRNFLRHAAQRRTSMPNRIGRTSNSNSGQWSTSQTRSHRQWAGDSFTTNRSVAIRCLSVNTLQTLANLRTVPNPSLALATFDEEDDDGT
jgi:hypothetical protein